MILLSTDYIADIIFIVLGLLIVLFFLAYKTLIFKTLARINKLIFPSLYNKDITKLKPHEKLIVAYRYWITRNSL